MFVDERIEKEELHIIPAVVCILPTEKDGRAIHGAGGKATTEVAGKDAIHYTLCILQYCAEFDLGHATA